MIDGEAKEAIGMLVRSGFEDRDRIIEILSEEMYEPGELDAGEVEAAVDEAIARHEAEKASWPEVTDWDRLDHAFRKLDSLGIIALHHAGYTQSDGYDDFRQALAEHPERGRIRGYCFYHAQDTERAIAGGGLSLAFGPVDPGNEKSEGPAIGSIIVQVLEEEGFSVDWNGTFEKRPDIREFDWKKR